MSLAGTVLTLELADFTLHVRCLEHHELADIRRGLDAEGDAGEVLLAGICRTLRAALVDEEGRPLLHDDAEAEAFVDRVDGQALARILGAAMAASSALAATLAFAVTGRGHPAGSVPAGHIDTGRISGWT